MANMKKQRQRLEMSKGLNITLIPLPYCLLLCCIITILTIWSIQVYQEKIKGTYTTENKNQVEIYIEEHWFTNDYMAKTFPNLRIRNNENQLIFARDYLQNIDIDKDIEI